MSERVEGMAEEQKQASAPGGAPRREGGHGGGHGGPGGGHGGPRREAGPGDTGASRRSAQGVGPHGGKETGAKREDMQIILQEDIEKLGRRGDVVTVKPGYARNFLLPQKLAVEATVGNLKAIERIRTSLAKKTATEVEAAQKQAELLNGVALKFTRKTGENDQMFGSVTSADIAEGLAAQGFKIDKRQAQLGEPLKTIGEFPVTIKVFRDVTAQIKVTVEKEA